MRLAGRSISNIVVVIAAGTLPSISVIRPSSR
jgi:hypothetical protein